MESEILAMMQCPVTRLDLTAADESFVNEVNSAISAGKATSQSGGYVSVSIEGGLVNSDGSLLVPLRAGIYCFNIESLIKVEQDTGKR